MKGSITWQPRKRSSQEVTYMPGRRCLFCPEEKKIGFGGHKWAVPIHYRKYKRVFVENLSLKKGVRLGGFCLLPITFLPLSRKLYWH
jgi:hypothetical protein